MNPHRHLAIVCISLAMSLFACAVIGTILLTVPSLTLLRGPKNRMPENSLKARSFGEFAENLGCPTVLPRTSVARIAELVQRSTLWAWLRLMLMRIPLLASLACMYGVLLIFMLFGYSPGGLNQQLRVRVSVVVVYLGIWSVIIWALPAHIGEITPRFLAARRVVAISRLLRRQRVELVLDDLLLKITRLRRRVCLFLLVQNGEAGGVFGQASVYLDTALQEAADAIKTHPDEGTGQLQRSLWLTMGVLAMDPQALRLAAGADRPLVKDDWPDPDRLPRVGLQRTIYLLPRAAICAAFLALALSLYATPQSALWIAAVPALISAGAALVPALVERRSVARRTQASADATTRDKRSQ